jgi:hypothetical protein
MAIARARSLSVANQRVTRNSSRKRKNNRTETIAEEGIPLDPDGGESQQNDERPPILFPEESDQGIPHNPTPLKEGPQYKLDSGNFGSHRTTRKNLRLTEYQLIQMMGGRSDVKDALRKGVFKGIVTSQSDKVRVKDVSPKEIYVNQRSKSTPLSRIPPSTRPLQKIGCDIIHCDSPTVGRPEWEAMLILVDYYSGYVWGYPVRSHEDVTAAFKRFYVDTQARPECFVVDYDAQFLSKKCTRFLTDNYASVFASSPYRHFANGKVESTWKSISHMMKFYLTQARLSRVFWGWCFKHSIQVYNVLPKHHPVEGLSTPYEILYKKKPDLRWLFRFGSIVFLREDGKSEQFTSNVTECIALCRDEISQSLITLNPQTGKIRVTGNYKLDEEGDYILEIEGLTPDNPEYRTLHARWSKLRISSGNQFQELTPFSMRGGTAQGRMEVGTKLMLEEEEVMISQSLGNDPGQGYEVVWIADGKVHSRIITSETADKGAFARACADDYILNDEEQEDRKPARGDLVYVKFDDGKYYEALVEKELQVTVKPQGKQTTKRAGFRANFAASRDGKQEYLDVPYDCRGTEAGWTIGIRQALVTKRKRQLREAALDTKVMSLAIKDEWWKPGKQFEPVMADYEQHPESGKWEHPLCKINNLILAGMKEGHITSLIPHPYNGLTGKELAAAQKEDVNNLERNPSGSIPQPKSAKDLKRLSPRDQHIWKRADMMEMRGLEDTGTYTVVKSPANGRHKLEGNAVVLPTYMVRKAKKEGNEYVKTKSRLVCLGNRDPNTYSKDETSSWVTGFDELKMFMSEAIHEGCPVYSLDVAQAFLMSPMPDKYNIYIRPPPEMETIYGKGTLLKLRKSLYGLVSAPKLWNNVLTKHLKDIGLEPLGSDESVFVGQVRVNGTLRKSKLHVASYVDDLAFWSKDPEVVREFRNLMKEKFTITADEERLTNFIGTTFQWETDGDGSVPKDPSLMMHQSAYVETCVREYMGTYRDNVWNKHSWSYSRGFQTPSGDKESDTLPDRDDMVDGAGRQKSFAGELEDQYLPDMAMYRQLLGCAGWLASRTRPDIAYVYGRLAKHSNHAGIPHMRCMMQLWGYLYATRELGLGFHCERREVRMNNVAHKMNWPAYFACCDADLGGKKFDKATCGRVVFRAHGPVSTHISEPFVCLSTAESELGGLAATCMDIDYVDMFLTDLLSNGGVERPTVLLTDNQTAIQWASSGGNRVRTRHLALRGNMVRHQVKDKRVRLCHVRSEYNPADLLTKDFLRNKTTVNNFHRLREALLGLSEAQALEHWSKLIEEDHRPNVPSQKATYREWLPEKGTPLQGSKVGQSSKDVVGKALATIPYGGMLRERGDPQDGDPIRSSRRRKLVENRGRGSVRTETAASEGERPSRIEAGHRRGTMSARHLTRKVESPSEQWSKRQLYDSTLPLNHGDERDSPRSNEMHECVGTTARHRGDLRVDSRGELRTRPDKSMRSQRPTTRVSLD